MSSRPGAEVVAVVPRQAGPAASGERSSSGHGFGRIGCPASAQIGIQPGAAGSAHRPWAAARRSNLRQGGGLISVRTRNSGRRHQLRGEPASRGRAQDHPGSERLSDIDPRAVARALGQRRHRGIGDWGGARAADPVRDRLRFGRVSLTRPIWCFGAMSCLTSGSGSPSSRARAGCLARINRHRRTAMSGHPDIAVP
ncbi:hypothetical protein ACVIHD_007938 [Bradyrhizobium embrapense]